MASIDSATCRPRSSSLSSRMKTICSTAAFSVTYFGGSTSCSPCSPGVRCAWHCVEHGRMAGRHHPARLLKGSISAYPECHRRCVPDRLSRSDRRHRPLVHHRAVQPVRRTQVSGASAPNPHAGRGRRRKPIQGHGREKGGQKQTKGPECLRPPVCGLPGNFR